MTSKHPFAPPFVGHKGGESYIPPMCFPAIPPDKLEKLPTRRERIIMKDFPPCPKCRSIKYVWSMGSAKGKTFHCQKCNYRWTPDKSEQPSKFGTFYGPWNGKEIIKLEDTLELLPNSGSDWSFYKGKRTWSAWNARDKVGDICIGNTLMQLLDSLGKKLRSERYLTPHSNSDIIGSGCYG